MIALPTYERQKSIITDLFNLSTSPQTELQLAEWARND